MAGRADHSKHHQERGQKEEAREGKEGVEEGGGGEVGGTMEASSEIWVPEGGGCDHSDNSGSVRRGGTNVTC